MNRIFKFCIIDIDYAMNELYKGYHLLNSLWNYRMWFMVNCSSDDYFIGSFNRRKTNN